MAKTNPLLSAIIIAKDEEIDLPGCLKSLQGLCDEIVIIVGTESSDQTEIIARQYGATVALRTFDDYAAQKQAALDLASGEWVLSIDCDERVSPELDQEIKRVLANSGKYSAFEIPFQIFFMGRRLRFGGLGSESHLRLFRRSAGHFCGSNLHESIRISGKIGKLEFPIKHIPYRNLSEYISKMNLYTELASKKRIAAGKRFHFWRHALLPWEFFSRAVLRLGVLDGHAGLIWAGLSAFHRWLKYAKLKELEDFDKNL
ncbi:MAG: glycosyltransferase family 2 protein [Elusimicrobiota bacterium]